jgi:signal transduction histidine kinase
MNLIENAAHAMGRTGLIVIDGAVDGDVVQISVSDDGPGISPELHDRVFEFSQSANNQPMPGNQARLGFGLWWVKTLMVRLGGAVHVESDGKSGTTFWLSIPRVGADA